MSIFIWWAIAAVINAFIIRYFYPTKQEWSEADKQTHRFLYYGVFAIILAPATAAIVGVILNYLL